MSESLQLDAYLATLLPEEQPEGCGVWNERFKNANWLTPVGHVLYCNLDAPRAFPGDPDDRATYNITLGFNPDTVVDLDQYMQGIANYMWPGTLLKDWPLRDGNAQYDKVGQERYFGTKYINAKMRATTQAGQERKPQLFRLDESGKAVPTGAEIFTPGCYAQAMISIAAWNNRQFRTNGIGTYLSWVTFIKAGAPLSGGFAAMQASKIFQGSVPQFIPGEDSGETEELAPPPAAPAPTAPPRARIVAPGGMGTKAPPGPSPKAPVLPQAQPRGMSGTGAPGPQRPGFPPRTA